MKKSDAVKERIIKTTIGLLTESGGDVERINTRAIAEKAGVGMGLINYHFQTKENLIDICVERIIGSVISAFNPAISPELKTPVDRVKHIAKLVADFLVDHPAVSRISILSDYKNPKTEDNTIKSAKGFSYTLRDIAISEEERFILAFTLTSVMQALFLRKEQSGALFGYDVNCKAQRDRLLDLLMERIFGGFE